MDWTTTGAIASLVAASAAAVGLVWRFADWWNARPRVTIEEASVTFSGGNQTSCSGLQLKFKIRNLSTAMDVLETVYVQMEGRRLDVVGWATYASPPCQVGAVPYSGSGTLQDAVAQRGETLSGRVIFQMRRAGRKEVNFETTCN